MGTAEKHTENFAIIDSEIQILFAAKGILYMLTNAYIKGRVVYHFEFNTKYEVKFNYCKNQLWFSRLIIDCSIFTSA